MADQPVLNYNKSPVSEETFVNLRKMDVEAGLLGKLFGGPSSAPMNIAGIVCFLLILCGVVYTCLKGMTEALDFWKLITPVVTLVLGYLFGKRK